MKQKETLKKDRVIFSVSFKPEIQKILDKHCEKERRKKSQMLEVMILNYKQPSA